MRATSTTLAVLAVLVMFSFPIDGQSGRDAQQAGAGSVAGTVTDSSGGVLPGVTITVRTASGQLLATEGTNGSGGYVVRNLPAGTVALTFQLEGFAEATAFVVVQAGMETKVSERLGVAPLSETVVVRAPGSTDRPRPGTEVPPPPPRLVARPLPEHDRAAVCGPAKPDPNPESLGTIKARLHDTPGELYLSGAELALSRGLEEGLLVGRNLVVRRYYQVRGANGGDVRAERSLGVVQIMTATEHTSVALVVYACDAMMKGDFLASFKPEPVRVPDPAGTPSYFDAARILFADEGQTLGVPDRMMVIDRGTRQGVHVGQRFTLFREGKESPKRTPAGDAIVVSVRNDSATIRILRVTDAVMAGDLAAPQSPLRSATALP